LEKRFGEKTRQLLAPALIVVFITWTGAEIYAAGNIIAPFLGIPLFWTLLFITIVVAIYSYSGGFEAVVSTDKIQFLLVAVFLSTLAVIAFKALPADSSLFDFPDPPLGKSSLFFFSPGPALILITFFAYLPGWLIETDVWIRLQAARSDKAARRGITLAAVNPFIFVGIMPRVSRSVRFNLIPACRWKHTRFPTGRLSYFYRPHEKFCTCMVEYFSFDRFDRSGNVYNRYLWKCGGSFIFV